VESTVHLLKQEKKGRREEREKERKTKEWNVTKKEGKKFQN
jgi:hypothetical protein